MFSSFTLKHTLCIVLVAVTATALQSSNDWPLPDEDLKAQIVPDSFVKTNVPAEDTILPQLSDDEVVPESSFLQSSEKADLDEEIKACKDGTGGIKCEAGMKAFLQEEENTIAAIQNEARRQVTSIYKEQREVIAGIKAKMAEHKKNFDKKFHIKAQLELFQRDLPAEDLKKAKTPEDFKRHAEALKMYTAMQKIVKKYNIDTSKARRMSPREHNKHIAWFFAHHAVGNFDNEARAERLLQSSATSAKDTAEQAAECLRGVMNVVPASFCWRSMFVYNPDTCTDKSEEHPMSARGCAKRQSTDGNGNRVNMRNGEIPVKCAHGYQRWGAECIKMCNGNQDWQIGGLCYTHCDHGWSNSGHTYRYAGHQRLYKNVHHTVGHGDTTVDGLYCSRGWSRKGKHYTAPDRRTNFDHTSICSEADQAKEGALCYKTCSTYGKLKDSLVQCGPGACASTPAACAQQIFNMVLETALAIASIAAMIVTAGGSTAAKAGVEAGKTLAQKVGSQALKNTAKGMTRSGSKWFKSAVVKHVGESLVGAATAKLIENVCGEIAEPMWDQVAKAEAEGEESGKFEEWITKWDPTGVANTVVACKEPESGVRTSADKLACSKEAIAAVGTFDPTGVAAMAAAFMHPNCEELPGCFDVNCEPDYVKKTEVDA